MADALEELKSISARINESSDVLNSTLQQVNTKLRELNFGLTVWLDGPPLAVKSVDPPARLLRMHIYKVEEREILGFTKIHQVGWCLAVVKLRVAHGHFEGDTSCPFSEVTEDDPRPLMECSRDLRVAAIELLPKIFELLKAEGNRLLASIEQVKEFADQL